MIFPLICRCYADELANKTIDEVRQIYSVYPNPSCVKYQNEDMLSFDLYKNDTGSCDRWIYELDHGYKSMSSEVRITKSVYSSFFPKINIVYVNLNS